MNANGRRLFLWYLSHCEYIQDKFSFPLVPPDEFMIYLCTLLVSTLKKCIIIYVDYCKANDAHLPRITTSHSYLRNASVSYFEKKFKLLPLFNLTISFRLHNKSIIQAGATKSKCWPKSDARAHTQYYNKNTQQRGYYIKATRTHSKFINISR